MCFKLQFRKKAGRGSGVNDLNYLDHLGHFLVGHFFGGLHGFHPETNLSECDPNF